MKSFKGKFSRSSPYKVAMRKLNSFQTRRAYFNRNAITIFIMGNLKRRGVQKVEKFVSLYIKKKISSHLSKYETELNLTHICMLRITFEAQHMLISHQTYYIYLYATAFQIISDNFPVHV